MNGEKSSLPKRVWRDRRKTLFIISLLFSFAVVVLLTRVIEIQNPPYKVTDLGTFGGNDSWACAINNSGQVVGWAHDAAGNQVPFFWTEENGMVQIPGGAIDHACFLSDSGVVAGVFSVPGKGWEAFHWNFEEGLSILEDLPPGDPVIAGINSQGDIAGSISLTSVTKIPTAYPFIRTATGHLILPATEGYTVAWASGIDDRQRLMGSRGDTVNGANAYLWSAKEGYRNLGTIEGYPRSDAFRIDDRGKILGRCYKKKDLLKVRTVIWDEEGTLVDLGTLGKERNEGRSMNGHGKVVGVAGKGLSYTEGWREVKAFFGFGNPPWRECAFLWTEDSMVDLNDLLPSDSDIDELVCANDINDRGQIVGIGTTPAGNMHAVVLSPIDETD